MNFYQEWQSNRAANCCCKWCRGEFHASTKTGTHDWENCVWNGSLNKILPEEACCVFKTKLPPAPNTIGASMSSKTGFNCKRCNFKNDYASANQKDGSYICYNCR